MIVLSMSPSRLRTYGLDENSNPHEVAKFIQSKRWSLGKRALNESILAIVTDHIDSVSLPWLIWDIEAIDDEGAIRLGSLLGSSEHPAYQTHVLVARNPISYVRLDSDMTTCACGCGIGVKKTANFLPGHDQRALHDRVKRYFGGSVLKAIQELDKMFGESAES